MKHLASLAALAAGLLVSGAVVAAEQTVTLGVGNMYCAACPATVKKALSAVPGVIKVEVSYKDKSAIVTFDDSKATIERITAASTNAGYPAKLAQQGR